MLGKFISKELAHPSTLISQCILAPMWNKRNSVLNDTAFDAMDLSQEDRVLDTGCGGGYLLGRILKVVPNGHVAGVDSSLPMIRYCQRHYRKQVRTGKLTLHWSQAERLPLGDGSFTKACSVNSLFYWDDIQKVFSEVRRILQPRAKLILCFTDRRSLESRPFIRDTITLYEADDVHRMLEKAGFVVESSTEKADKHREFWCIVANK